MLGDPNVAYLLFLLGLLGITAEVYHPGSLVPGTVGVIALVLSFIGFASLPISAAGILLVVLALGLFVGELHTGAGGLAVAALVALVAGSLIFYSRGPAPHVHVSPALVVVMSLVFVAFFLVVVRATLRARRLSVKTGISVLLGHGGVAMSELTPRGTVRVDGEAWSAESLSGPVHAGDQVMVIGGAGVTLHVLPADELQGGAPWTGFSPTSS